MAAMRRATKRWHIRSERGAELIEMMLVTPVLLLIFAGIFDFAMLFRAWETVTNAAREGARVASLPAYTEDEDVRARVEQYMQATGLATTCTLETVANSQCPNTGGAGTCTVCVSPDSLDGPDGTTFSVRSVTVVSKQSMPSLSAFAPFFGGSFGNVSVGSTSVMRTEAPAE
jgi:Flp pilus assembly protein TadG